MNRPTPFHNAIATLLLAVALLLSVTTSAKAQAAIKVFKVGDRVEMNIANDVLNEDRWIKGTVTEVLYSDGRILSYKVKRDGEYVQQFGNLARVIRPLNEGGGDASTTPPNKEMSAPSRADSRPADGANSGTSAVKSGTNVDCSFEKYPPLGANGKFSEALIKSGLYERFSFEKDTGGLSSPLEVGVTVLSIQAGDSFTNTVTVNPARGAERKFDGAPPNVTIYRFHAKFVVCRKYRNATRQTQYDGENVMFKAANGNWACATNGDQHATDLN